MSDEIRIDGLGLKPGVLERIVTLAATQVDGVSSVCGQGLAGFVQKNTAPKGVEVDASDPDDVSVAIHVQAVYGKPLHEMSAAIKTEVAEAIRSQVGVTVSAVDVYVDDIVFDA